VKFKNKSSSSTIGIVILIVGELLSK